MTSVLRPPNEVACTVLFNIYCTGCYLLPGGPNTPEMEGHYVYNCGVGDSGWVIRAPWLRELLVSR